MSRTKKVLLATGGTLAILLAALVALPFLFIDEIEARVRSEIERATRVRVSWTDIGLTFFRDFPNPTLSLSGLSVVGTGSFDGDTLATVDDFRLALDGRSVIGAARGTGPLGVRSVRVAAPRVRLQVDEDGTTSWDILPTAAADSDGGPDGDTTGRAVAVSLQSFELTDGSLVLDNARSGLFVSASGLGQSLRGDFTLETLVASSSTRADDVTIRLAGAPYLSGVSLDFEAELDVDMAEQRARLSRNEMRLNDLVLGLEGEVARVGEDIAMDVSFSAPSTAFGEVLSLVPVIYAQDFASLETTGTFSLTGNVRGAYGRNTFPGFALDLSVADGSFRYPDLPLGARAISAELSITNPGGDVDSTVADLSRFHVEIDGQTLDGTLVLRTPVSDPDIEASVRGTVDLADVAQTVKLENAEGLSGVIVADASLAARRSDVDSARYDRIAAEGSITARDVALRGEALRQPIDIGVATIRLTPRTAELQAFEATLGRSDIRANGRLDNLLGFVLGEEPLSGTADFASDRVMLDEWKSDNELAAIEVPGMLDLTLQGTIGQLVFNGVETTNARGRAIVRDQRLTLEGFSLEALGGRIGMDGFYETLDPAAPTFALDLVLDSLDVAGASETFLTVRALAPVARYARGTFSSELSLSGALGQDMAPVLEVLDGDGSLATSRVAIEGFPLLDRLSETLQLERLAAPTVDAVRSSMRIQGGRLLVDPFDVGIAGLGMTVSGSNGIDQSIDYTLDLDIPRAGLADAALNSLASRAGPLAASLGAIDPIPVAVRVTGTVTQPSLSVGMSDAAASARDAAARAAEEAAAARLEAARLRAEAEEEAARQRLQERADSIVADAERQAEAIRAEARRAAEAIRVEGNRAADELVARATNPLARAAAGPAADRLRREADERASAIEREADERAEAFVAEARERANALLGDGSPGG